MSGKLANRRGSPALVLTSVIALFLAIAVALSGCTNQPSISKIPVTPQNNTTSLQSTSVGPTYRISSVNLQENSSSSGGTASGGTATLFIDTTGITDSISNYCRSTSSSTSTTTSTSGSATDNKSCVCQFQWQEINQTSGENVAITRTVQNPAYNVQQSVVVCNLPSVYSTEIARLTTIKISIIPATGNAANFTVQPYNYTKGSTGSSSQANFQDSEGRAYQNIYRYSCYEKFLRGMAVRSRLATINNPLGEGESTRQMAIANQFCISGVSGADTDPACLSLPAPQYSAQSYYYNMYIRSTDRGAINAENSRYACPRVREVLNGDGSAGSQGNFWPLDSTFALAMSSSSDFSVGVESASKISVAGDGSTSSSCFATSNNGSGSSSSSSSSGTGNIITSCLGFAAKPNDDGTCPMIQGSSGNVIRTFRLRRFVAMYPPIFDSTGAAVKQSPALDTILVLDRPVEFSGADPLKPYTMRGPKPCPFAYFDHKRVLGSTPQYAATSFIGWNGTNVDGIEFPNIDNASTNSCSAALPLFNKTTGVLSLGTLNAKNPVLKKQYIRPIRSWAPHYEEDTSFRACAPQAQPFRDAPLHFSKDPTNGNVMWCAESYPTQNDNVLALDSRDSGGSYSGAVVPFTSHHAAQSRSSECTATVPQNLTGYPTSGAAYHPSSLQIGSVNTSPVAAPTPGSTAVNATKTCDRTVVSSNPTWAKFPLLARSYQIEQAIASDSTYGCTVTYDGGGSKTGKTTPTEGCCGAAVDVWTGMDTCTSGTCNMKKYNRSAHLEPDATCLTPRY